MVHSLTGQWVDDHVVRLGREDGVRSETSGVVAGAVEDVDFCAWWEGFVWRKISYIQETGEKGREGFDLA
jgi:hypothetical protein